MDIQSATVVVFCEELFFASHIVLLCSYDLRIPLDKKGFKERVMLIVVKVIAARCI